LVTTRGKEIVVDLLVASTSKYIEVGTGNTAEAAGQTALVTPVETRATGTQSKVTTTTTNDTYQAVGTVTATAVRALQESGVFDAATAGNMLARGVFTTVNLASADSIALTWKIALT